MIPRVAYLMILGALAFVVLAAAAGSGLLDRLPPQPYFPPELAEPRERACDPEGAQYPDSIVETRTTEPVVDDFHAQWFGVHLRAAQEVSLSRPPPSDEPSPARSIRFTWLRTFHQPVVVRIDETPDGRMRLTARRLTGLGGYDPGGVADRRDRDLTPAEAETLRRALARIDVFELLPLGCGGGVDGAEWILEARQDRRYHLARRWTPKGGGVHELGLLLLGFTHWEFERVY